MEKLYCSNPVDLSVVSQSRITGEYVPRVNVDTESVDNTVWGTDQVDNNLPCTSTSVAQNHNPYNWRMPVVRKRL